MPQSKQNRTGLPKQLRVSVCESYRFVNVFVEKSINQLQAFLHCLGFYLTPLRSMAAKNHRQMCYGKKHHSVSTLSISRFSPDITFNTKQRGYTHGFLQLLPEIVILLFELPRIRNRLQGENCKHGLFQVLFFTSYLNKQDTHLKTCCLDT